MYSELRRIHIEEKRSNNISILKEDFYVEVHQYIDKTKKKLNDDSDPAVRRELENCLKILNEVQKRRVEKIIVYSFNEIYNGFDSLDNLTQEEKELYDLVKKDVTQIKKNFENCSAKRKEDIIKVRVLKEIPKFKGHDGNNYGPFNEGDICELPRTTGELVVKNKKAEMIE